MWVSYRSDIKQFDVFTDRGPLKRAFCKENSIGPLPYPVAVKLTEELNKTLKNFNLKLKSKIEYDEVYWKGVEDLLKDQEY